MFRFVLNGFSLLGALRELKLAFDSGFLLLFLPFLLVRVGVWKGGGANHMLMNPGEGNWLYECIKNTHKTQIKKEREKEKQTSLIPTFEQSSFFAATCWRRGALRKHLRAITWMALDVTGLDGPPRWLVDPWNQTLSLLHRKPRWRGRDLLMDPRSDLSWPVRKTSGELYGNVFPLDRINSGCLCRGAVNVVKV